MTWMTLVDPKDHILKVSGEYLNFQLSYSGLLNKLLTCGKREGEERGSGNFSGCLAKCKGWAKGCG